MGEGEGGVDQADVGEGLGEIACGDAADRIDLLAEKPHLVGVTAERLQQVLRLLDASAPEGEEAPQKLQMPKAASPGESALR